MSQDKFKRHGLCGNALRHPTPQEMARITRRIAAMKKRKMASEAGMARTEYVPPARRFVSTNYGRKRSTVVKGE